jgi:hypothetical protein
MLNTFSCLKCQKNSNSRLEQQQMSFPDRVNCLARNAGTLYVIAAAIFWVSALLMLLFTSLKWVGALDFVAGVVLLLLWQIWRGEKSVSN